MFNASSHGTRCRAIQSIKSYQGTVRVSTEGTVRYEIENLGRRLVNVQWDNGVNMNVFADEVEVFDGGAAWRSNPI
jgi:hypothetical protein